MKIFGRRAFTLVELVMVVVIIAVIAIIAIPKFISLRRQAIDGAEDAIIGAVKTGVHLKYTENIIKGVNNLYGGGAWPMELPFKFVQPEPPYKQADGNPGDGVNWSYNDYGDFCWALLCPHYDGVAHKGQYWRYTYGTGSTYGEKPGDFVLVSDYGH